ncbi:MAG TPA: hypothetical protein ENF20_02580 [Candidatus Marinimicrobia bacterium]|nr:hypothetical protein [Candidatus Neomarinimicrobiota bacterium]
MEEEVVKIAIPMFNSRVSPRFDFAAKILIATIESGKISERQEYALTNIHQIRRSSLLCELGVKVLICGGISSFCHRLITDNGIRVIPMIQGEIEEVLNHYTSGNLISSREHKILGKRNRCQSVKRRWKGRTTR